MLSILSQFAAECNGGSFFGLQPWYEYINDAQHFNGCDLQNFKLLGGKSDVPLVLLAVVNDLLRIAAIFAIGFVIVGAIKFITSQGDPEATGKAQSSIVNALIGLAVAMIAVGFVSFIGNELGQVGGGSTSRDTISAFSLPRATGTAGDIGKVLSAIFALSGALALVVIVVSGLRYITSTGNPERVSKAKNGIIYALVGLVLVIIAQSIVVFVVNRL